VFLQSNFKDVMESLAVARTEYEQKTGVIAAVRPALLYVIIEVLVLSMFKGMEPCGLLDLARGDTALLKHQSPLCDMSENFESLIL
jgi:hypothetical protein